MATAGKQQVTWAKYRKPCGHIETDRDRWRCCAAARDHDGPHAFTAWSRAAHKASPRAERKFGGWQVWVIMRDGRILTVGVTRGKSVRIAYKPRGENRGYHWHGFATLLVPEHCDLYRKGDIPTRVTKNIGVRGLLKEVGLLPAKGEG